MRSRLSSIALLALALLLTLTATDAAAQATRVVAVEDQSGVWIDGTSSVNEFTCKAGELAGFGRMAGGEQQAEAQVLMPVTRFDCGKKKMNQDFYEAMQANKQPVIRFRLTSADLLDAPASQYEHDAYRLQIAGVVALAGKQEEVEFAADARALDQDRWIVEGRIPLRMSDFGIEPPSALFGLIKARDPITVRFRLVGRASDGTSIGVSPQEALDQDQLARSDGR